MRTDTKRMNMRPSLNRRTFLKATASTAAFAGMLPAERLFAPGIARAALKPEKEDLKFGFIKLTDMAPIAIAKELNFFEDEGLYVSAEPQANCRVDEDVATLIPHSPGCANFPLPVLHGRASLAKV